VILRGSLSVVQVHIISVFRSVFTCMCEYMRVVKVNVYLCIYSRLYVGFYTGISHLFV